MRNIIILLSLFILSSCAVTSAPDLCAEKDAQTKYPFACGPHA